jgi:deoxyribose-phosphate aldolase
MTLEPKDVERLVETVTRQVLLSLAMQKNSPHEAECQDCQGGGLCIQMCTDKVRQVMAAGAERLTAGIGVVTSDRQIASMIDHTLLKPEATHDQVAQLCFEARKFNFASVCVNPTHVKLCAQLLKGSSVKVCTVIGFPLGATATEVKAFEASQALDEGATEIDMVINIGALKAKDYETVLNDIRAVVRTGHAKAALVKVILETALLTDEEKIAACLLCREAGADFVKTSTGFGPGGATAEDVALMRKVVGAQIGVKASGGIRSLDDTQQMIKAGATRIGASAGVKIMGELSGAKPVAATPSPAPKAY